MNRSTALASCLSALTLIAVAAPVQAGAGEMEGGDYRGDPGVNNVTVAFDGTDMTYTDSAGITNLDAFIDCTPLSATSVRCPYTVNFTYSIRLDGSNDSFAYLGGAPPLPTNASTPFTNPNGEFFHVDGGAGADVLNGSPYRDVFQGGGVDFNGDEPADPAGNDQVFGNGGNDSINDRDGSSNHFDGGPGDDAVDFNGLASGTLLGGTGNDVVSGGEGPDTVDGEDGNDSALGGGGNDTVRGGAGDDVVEGGEGADVSDGGPGNDSVAAPFHGSACNTDTLIGGPGVDSFYVACGVPTLKFRDGVAETGRCLKAVTNAVKEYDKTDNASGGACQTFVKKCKKKKKKGKGKSASTAKKKKKKRCTREPYKPPDPDA